MDFVRFLLRFMLFEDGHWRSARVCNPRDGTKVLADEVQGVVVAVGFEENGEVPISEETVRGFDYNALHWLIGHLRESVPEFSALSRANLEQH